MKPILRALALLLTYPCFYFSSNLMMDPGPSIYYLFPNIDSMSTASQAPIGIGVAIAILLGLFAGCACLVFALVDEPNG